MIARNILVSVVLGLFCYPQLATAQLIHATCKTYFRSDLQGAPKEITAFFAIAPAGSPDLALRQCSADAEKVFSSELLFPVQSDAGVCHFKERDISGFFSETGAFLAEKAHGPAKVEAYSSEAMTVSGLPCPRQDNEAYVSVTAIPVGVFRSIMQFWSRMTSTADDLAGAFLLSPDDARSRTEFERFRLMMKDHYSAAPPMRWIYLSDISLNGRALYELHVRNPNAVGSGWDLGLDLTDQGWKVVRIDAWVA